MTWRVLPGSHCFNRHKHNPTCLPEALGYAAFSLSILAFGAVEPWSQAMVFVLLSTSLLLHLLSGEPPPASTPIGCLLVGIALILVVGILQLRNSRLPTGIENGLLLCTVSSVFTREALLRWLGYFVWILNLIYMLRDRTRIRNLAWLIFVLGMLVSIIGIVQANAGNTRILGFREVGPGFSPFGLFFNGNHAAAFMTICFWMGLGISFPGISHAEEVKGIGDTAERWAKRVLMLAGVGIVFFGILVTQCRAAIATIIVGTFVGILAFAFSPRLSTRWRLSACVSVLLLCVGGVLCVFHSPEFLGLYGGGQEGRLEVSTIIRLSMYRSALRLLGDHGLSGIGLGAISAIFPAYQDRLVLDKVIHVHCDWLEFACEVGLLAGAAFMFSMLWPLWRGWREICKSDGARFKMIELAGLIAAAGFLLHETIDFPLQTPGIAITFFTVLCMCAWRQKMNLGFWAMLRRSSFSSRLQMAPLAVLLVILSVGPALGSYYVWRARSSPPSVRPFYLTKAISWSDEPRYAYEMGMAYFWLAEANPAAAPLLLRYALRWSGDALRSAPLDPRFRQLYAAVLWRLGHETDASSMLIRKRTSVDHRRWYELTVGVRLADFLSPW